MGSLRIALGDDDRRHPQPVDDAHHVVSVGTSVDVVVKLDHRDVALIEQLGAYPDRRCRAVNQLPDDRASEDGELGHSQNADVGATCAQGIRQGSAELASPPCVGE